MILERFSHRGYKGSFSYSFDGKYYYGQVLEINDSVTYRGASMDDLESNFKKAVDDYVDIILKENS